MGDDQNNKSSRFQTKLSLPELAHAARGSRPGDPAHDTFQAAVQAQREADALTEIRAQEQRIEKMAEQAAQAEKRAEYSSKFPSSSNDPLVKARSSRSH